MVNVKLLFLKRAYNMGFCRLVGRASRLNGLMPMLCVKPGNSDAGECVRVRNKGCIKVEPQFVFTFMMI